MFIFDSEIQTKMKITSVQTYIRVVRRDMSSSDPYPCDTLSGLTAPSACRVREVCGLCIGQRTMTDGAMDGLFNREGCVPVSLPNFKIAHFHKNAPLAGSKQVVLCVVERNLYSKTQDKVYSVTDMRTMKARLVLSEEVGAQRHYSAQLLSVRFDAIACFVCRHPARWLEGEVRPCPERSLQS